MPEFQIVIDPPSPVHENELNELAELAEGSDVRRLSTESVGKCT